MTTTVPGAVAPAWSTRIDVWRRFREHRPAFGGLVVIGLIVVLAVGAPALVGLQVLPDPYALDVTHVSQGPSWTHLLGTDQLGRDLLSRTLHGARISLSIAVLAQVIVLAIGGTVGLVAGYVGGRTDNVLMRLTDIMFAFPDLVFVLVIAAVLGAGYLNILLAIGVVGWPFLARLVRGDVLRIRELDYVAAAHSSGGRPVTIIARHLVPNALGPVIVTLTFNIPAAIFAEAFLSFIGIGLAPPTPSWGNMINDGYQAVFAYPHQVLAPAVAISLTTLAFNFVGDGLRDALDPRQTGPRP